MNVFKNYYRFLLIEKLYKVLFVFLYYIAIFRKMLVFSANSYKNSNKLSLMYL